MTTEKSLADIQMSRVIKGKSSTAGCVNPFKKVLYFLLDGNSPWAWVSLGQPSSSRCVMRLTTGISIKEKNQAIIFKLDTKQLQFPSSLKCFFGLSQLVVGEQIKLPPNVSVKSWTGTKWE